jgi:hypothetical protein
LPIEVNTKIPSFQGTVHGLQKLPEGHALVLPETAKFKDSGTEEHIKICSDYNILEVAVSIGQLLFSVTTLYRTRGNQIGIFGYAAFGLTVTQYAWMSLINLVGNLMAPQYSTIFLVGSETLDELRTTRRSESFAIEGEVGRITEDTEKAVKTGSPYPFTDLGADFAYSQYMVSLAIAAMPIIITAGISGFNPGGSALYRRVWTMMWLVFGISLGQAVYLMENILVVRNPYGQYWVKLLYGALYCAPSIGGFVVLGQIIASYGVCSKIPG